MDPWPAPSRSRGRGRGRGGGARGGHGGGKIRGKSTSGTVDRAVKSLPANHDRYERPLDDEDSSGEEGLDFELVAAAGFHSETLDGGKSASPAEDIVGRELAADFSKLADTLRSVPMWIRLGGDERIRIALDGQGMGALSAYDGHEGETGTRSPEREDLGLASESLLKDLGEIEVSVPVETTAPKPRTEDDDDFDAWLDKA
jgi:hypothetical protein